MTYPETDFILRLLTLSARDDISLYWHINEESETEDRLTCYINCNDLFAWATADAEEVTPENISVLEQAIKDVKEVGGLLCYAEALFACRVRKMRPQKPAYPGMIRSKEHKTYILNPNIRQQDLKLHKLFDDCGPPE